MDSRIFRGELANLHEKKFHLVPPQDITMIGNESVTALGRSAQMSRNVTKRTTKCPTPHSRICNGATVQVTGGQFKGRVGKAIVLVGSIWSVKVDGVSTPIGIHRTCLKRVVEGQVAA
jgi:hypothetical protein